MTTVARRPSAQDIPNTPAGPQGATCQGERGFTLIELSIVLVIIGLLIGGVLQGQEMINNTRVKTTVAQMDAITAAVQTFEDKYRSLPGDAPAAITTLLGVLAPNAGTQGNGIIEVGAAAAAAITNATTVAAQSEAALVFAQLGQSNLLQEIDVGILTLATATASTIDARIAGGQFEVAMFPFAVIGQRLGIRVRGGTAAAPAALLTPVDMFSLDQRYDDGVGNTGRWQADVAAAPVCHAAGVYTAAGNAAACVPVVAIR